MNDTALKKLTIKPHCPDFGKTRLAKSAERPKIGHFWIGGHGTNIGVAKNNSCKECAQDCGSQAQSRQVWLSDGQVDSSRTWLSRELACMFGIIRPAIPLDPANWPSGEFDREDMRRLSAIHARAEMRFDLREIEGLTPPRRNVWRAKPALKQMKVGSEQRTERRVSLHRKHRNSTELRKNLCLYLPLAGATATVSALASSIVSRRYLCGLTGTLLMRTS